MVVMIRLAELEDVGTIKTLVEKMVEESTDSVPILDRSITIERATRNREILVATVDGHAVEGWQGRPHRPLITGSRLRETPMRGAVVLAGLGHSSSSIF